MSTITTAAPPAVSERDLDHQPAAAASVDAVKVYGSGAAAVTALDGVSARFRRGELAAVMGPSGSGKSTLMQCMAGLDTLTGGTVYLDGVDLAGLSDRELTILRRERVGFVFQAYNLVPTLDVRRNITLALDIAGTKPDKAWIAEVVGALGLSDRLKHRPSELSGGQQQRAAIARALASRPAVVFADEPTGALDTETGRELLRFLRRAVDDFGQTVVMVTHDPNAAAIADRVLFLADGHIAAELGEPDADTVLDRMRTIGGRS